MTTKSYMISQATIGGMIALTPWLDELLKVYLIIALTLIIVSTNLLFRLKKVEDLIVERLVERALTRILMDKDVQEVIRARFKVMAEQSKKEHGDHSK